jgi:hypothetical protein
MRLVGLVCSIHRRACLLGSQTTNRIFNYRRDIPNGELRGEYQPYLQALFDDIDNYIDGQGRGHNARVLARELRKPQATGS